MATATDQPQAAFFEEPLERPDIVAALTREQHAKEEVDEARQEASNAKKDAEALLSNLEDLPDGSYRSGPFVVRVSSVAAHRRHTVKLAKTDATPKQKKGAAPTPIKEPDAEMQTMTVDGEEAQVKRPRGRRLLQTPAASNGATAAPIAAIVDPTTPWDDDNPVEHVFKAGELSGCYTCGHGEDSEHHVTQFVADMINESRRTPATPTEAEQQAEAEAALANHGRK